MLRGFGMDHQALEKSGGGRFKEKDPTVDAGIVAQRLVCPSDTLYIGKQDSGVSASRGLQKRVTDLVRFGEGRPVGHWGGRYLWQLSDDAKLRVAWLKVGDSSAREVEDPLLTEFFNFYGQLPSANVRR